ATPEKKKEIEAQRRSAALMAKVLQNMSNGEELGVKEEYMAPLNDLVKDANGEWGLGAKALRTYLKIVADRGRYRLNAPQQEQADRLPSLSQADLPRLLNHPAARQVFHDALVVLDDVESLDFWVKAQAKPSGAAAQEVYDSYLADGAPKQVQLSSAQLAE